MDASYGGYNHSFVDKSSEEKFKCTICTKVLRNPHVTSCCIGPSFCESCLNHSFTENGKECCPHCQAEGEEFQHFLNKALKREIDTLKIQCTNKGEGCDWVGELRALKDHLEPDNGCGYVEVECPNKCTKKKVSITERDGLTDNTKIGKIEVEPYVNKVQRRHRENHLTNDCDLRRYQCEYCGYEDTYKAITGRMSGSPHNHHYTVCPEIPLECFNKCGAKNIKRKEMEDHCKTCEMEPVQCPFKEAKCHAELVRRELEQHISSNQQQHLLMVMEAYKEVKQANDESEQATVEIKLANEELKRDNAEMKQAFREMERVNKKMEEANIEMKKELEETKAELQQIKQKLVD